MKSVHFISAVQVVCLIAMAWVVIDLKRDLHETHMLYKNESHWAIACNQSIDTTVTAIGKMILELDSRVTTLEENATATTYKTGEERAPEIQELPPLECPPGDPYIVSIHKPSEEVEPSEEVKTSEEAETSETDETVPTIEPIPYDEEEDKRTVGEYLDLPDWSGADLRSQGVTK